jgi:hypothetical protein
MQAADVAPVNAPLQRACKLVQWTPRPFETNDARERWRRSVHAAILAAGCGGPP